MCECPEDGSRPSEFSFLLQNSTGVKGMQGKVSLSVFFLFGRQFYAAPTGYVAEMIL